jgi:UDP-N-acetyl-D-mannosaminuronic acid dehydrogenase
VKNSVEKASVVGLGYVGLPTAAVLASRGVEVVGVEINETVVARINAGDVHITEPDLDILVQGTVATGRLRATIQPESAEVYVIAVPTPFKDNYEPDLTHIKAAAEAIAPVLERGTLVILESTSPVGTTEKLTDWLAAARPDLSFPGNSKNTPDISVAYCPERVLPGRVLIELVDNDRIIGGMSPECAEKAVDFYRIFLQGECHVTNAATAELAKLTENSYRDVNIAFANELSLICDHLDINVWELLKLANQHPRVDILKPGPGVGGHCIAIDPWFIVSSAPDQAHLIRTARTVNDDKPNHVVTKIKAHAARFKAPVVACLGLSYKPDIDDLRESPALKIAETLADAKVGEILVVEPHISNLPASLEDRSNLILTEAADAIEKADIVALLVPHRAFQRLNRATLDQKILIDTQGMWA